MSNNTNPFPLDQRAHDIGTDRYATDFFDFAACNWLAISDQGQRFEQGTRITRRPLFPQLL